MFNWSGDNSDKARHKGANEFVQHVLESMNGKEPITLIAHSHDGNVAIEAANILIKKHGINPSQINIFAVNRLKRNVLS